MAEIGVPIAVDITIDNFELIDGGLRRFPKALDEAIQRSLKDYYYQDFKSLLGRGLKGWKIRGVPSQNAPNWAAIKSRVYGITHSLGELTHGAGLHAGAMQVEPRIQTARNRTTLTADFNRVPSTGYPYLPVIELGLDHLHKKYPIIEGVQIMTEKKLIQRLESNVSEALKKTVGG